MPVTKNITLKVDDTTYQKARIRAAQAGTSVSAMVRDFLNREEDEETAREAKRMDAMKALYGKQQRRTPVTFDPELRELTLDIAAKVRNMGEQGHTPAASPEILTPNNQETIR